MKRLTKARLLRCFFQQLNLWEKIRACRLLASGLRERYRQSTQLQNARRDTRTCARVSHCSALFSLACRGLRTQGRWGSACRRYARIHRERSTGLLPAPVHCVRANLCGGSRHDRRFPLFPQEPSRGSGSRCSTGHRVLHSVWHDGPISNELHLFGCLGSSHLNRRLRRQ